eukprot:gene13959-29712_t
MFNIGAEKSFLFSNAVCHGAWPTLQYRLLFHFLSRDFSMNSFVKTTHAPGKLTLLAALLAGLSAPAVAVSPDLVISQVYAGGGNAGAIYNRDYVEIFNRGSVAVVMDGWSLQYASAANVGAWNNTATLPQVTIEPGQYVLFEQQGGSN